MPGGRQTEETLGYTRRFDMGGEHAKRLRKFGLTLSDYEFMAEFQNHACGICKTPQSKLQRKLAVDHCHSTGRIRGLLCSNCNTALGLLRDNPESIRRAARWIMTDEEAAN